MLVMAARPACREGTKALEGIHTATVKIGTEGVPHLNSLKNALGDVAKMASGFALGGIIQQFGQSFTSTIGQSIDSTKEFASQVKQLQLITGAAPEELSTTVAAFERFGVSTQEAGTSLGIFSRQLQKAPVDLAELGSGLGENGKPLKGFADTMHDLGVATEDASGKTRDTLAVFEDAADGIKKLGSGSEATAAAMTLFGRSGRDMLPVLLQGREGIAAAAEEAAKYGMVLTADNMASIRSFSLAQKDMNEALSGLRLQLGIALMPLLTALATVGANLAAFINQSLMPAIHNLGSYLGTTFIPAISVLASLIGSVLKPPLDALVGLWRALTDALQQDTPVARILQGVLAAIAGALGTLVVGLVAYEAWTNLATVASKAFTIASALLNAVLDANPIFLVVAAIGALVGVFIYAYQNIAPFTDAVNALFEALTGDPGALGVLYDVLKQVFGEGFGDTVRPVLQWFMDAIPLLKDAWNALVEAFTGDEGALGVVYDVIRKLFGDSVGDFMQPFLEWLRVSIPAFKQWVADFFGSFGSLDTFGTKLLEARSGILTVLSGLMGQVIPALYGAIDNLLQMGIAALITRFPEIAGPLRTLGSLIDAAFGVLSGTGRGLGQVLAGVRDFDFGEIFAGVIATISPYITVIGKLWDIARAAWVAWVQPALQAILTQLPGWITRLSNWINDQVPLLERQLLTWGAAFYQWVGITWNQHLYPELTRLWTNLMMWIRDQGVPLAKQLLTWAGDFIGWVAPLIPPLLVELGKLGVQLLGWVKDRAIDLASQLGDWTQEFLNWLGPVLGELLPKLAYLLGEITGWIASHAIDLAKALVAWTTEFVAWLDKVLPQLPGKLAEVVTSIANWIARGDGNRAIQDAGESFGKTFVDALWNYISTVLPQDLARLGAFLQQLGGQFSSGFGEQFPPGSDNLNAPQPTTGGAMVPFQHGGWLPEPVRGVGPSGTRYLLHANEFISPPGAPAVNAAAMHAGRAGGAGVSLTVSGTQITVSGAQDPDAVRAAIEEDLWSSLYGRLARAMDNRPTSALAY
jgi:TP901 family phage tail tape measure protein